MQRNNFPLALLPFPIRALSFCQVGCGLCAERQTLGFHGMVRHQVLHMGIHKFRYKFEVNMLKRWGYCQESCDARQFHARKERVGRWCHKLINHRYVWFSNSYHKEWHVKFLTKTSQVGLGLTHYPNHSTRNPASAFPWGPFACVHLWRLVTGHGAWSSQAPLYLNSILRGSTFSVVCRNSMGLQQPHVLRSSTFLLPLYQLEFGVVYNMHECTSTIKIATCQLRWVKLDGGWACMGPGLQNASGHGQMAGRSCA